MDRAPRRPKPAAFPTGAVHAGECSGDCTTYARAG